MSRYYCLIVGDSDIELVVSELLSVAIGGYKVAIVMTPAVGFFTNAIAT